MSDKNCDKESSTSSDDSRVTKVLTHKAGNFAFSRNHSVNAVFMDVAIFEGLHLSLSNMPILPAIAAKLETELIRKAVFSTAAIEGNPLSEERVGELMEEPTLEALRDRAEQEIVNLKEAYKLYSAPVAEKKKKPLPVTEEFIRAINERVTRGLTLERHSPGQYRNTEVKVGNAEHGGTYVPPKNLEDIRILMAAFTEWLNSEAVLKAHPAIRAALAHYHLALIHPFGDGNGRTARLLEVAIMTHGGYRYVPTMLSNYYYKNMDAYYIVFRECEKSKDHDVTPFLSFFAKGLNMSAMELQATISGHIRLLALGEHYRKLREQKDISQRHHDLLMILLQKPDKVVELAQLRSDPLLAPLYRKTSEATPRRDLKRMQELKLLLPAEGGGLRLNQFTLG